MASTSLRRTIGTATSTTKGTFSYWVKRAILTDDRMVTSWGSVSSQFLIAWQDYAILIGNYDGSYNLQYKTNRLFRDTSAWYHIVVAIDTTLATSTDRFKLYVNGVQETSFSTSTAPSQNLVLNFSNNGEEFRIGERDSGEYLNGSMSHFHFIDGTAYDASTFGETDATTGIWKPKTAPSVTYGTNGFFLKFENSANMDLDSSPNNLTFTTSGTLTQTVDTPSNVFATLNPLLDVYVVGTYSNGNLGFTGTGSTNFGGCSMPVSKGKWYVEVKATTVSGSYPIIGVIDAQSSKRRDDTYFIGADINTNNPSGFAVFSNGDIYHNNSSSYGNLTTTYTSGDIIGMALDMDSATKTLAFYKNGTLETTINLDEPPNGSYIFCTAIYATSSSAKTDWNFGNGYFGTTAVSSATTDESGLGIFEYTVPSGYYALCTKNINTQG